MYIYDYQHFNQCCECIQKNNIFGKNLSTGDISEIISSLSGIEAADDIQARLILSPIKVSTPVSNDPIEAMLRIYGTPISDFQLDNINRFIDNPPVELLYTPDIDFTPYADQLASLFGRQFNTPKQSKVKLTDYLHLMWNDTLDSDKLCQKYNSDTPLEAMVKLFQIGADLENWCFPVNSITNTSVKTYFEAKYGNSAHIVVWRTWLHDIETNGDIYTHPYPRSANQDVCVAVSVNSKIYPLGLARGYYFDASCTLSKKSIDKAILETKNRFVRQSYQDLLSYCCEQKINLDDMISSLKTNEQTSFVRIDRICSEKIIEVDAVIVEALSCRTSNKLKQRRKKVIAPLKILFPQNQTPFSINYYINKPSETVGGIFDILMSPEAITANKKIKIDKFHKDTELVNLLASHLSEICVILNGKKVAKS